MKDEIARRPRIYGAVLAGGRSQRFGKGDKSLQAFGDGTLVSWVVERFAPQVDGLVICANGDLSRLPEFGVPVISDDIPGREGPLAGVVSAMAWLTRSRPEIEWIATVPVDVPFFPADLVSRLAEYAMPAGAPAIVTSGGRTHPVLGLWPKAVERQIRSYMARRNRDPIAKFVESLSGVQAEFPETEPDRFLNVNTPGDLAKAADLISEMSPASSRPSIKT